MLIDTHAHLYLHEFDEDRDQMMERALESGVSHFFLPHIDRYSTAALLQLEADYPHQCHAMMGLHPCSVKEDVEEALAHVRSWLEKRPFCAVGEIGLDLYWDKTWWEQQQEAFRRQIRWAKEFGMPIAIHSRDAMDACIDIVKKEKDDRLNGVFHCFSGTLEQARQIIELGFYMGIGGVATYKNGGLDQVIPHTGLEWVVLETDAPYLTPVPHRGKRNESAYLTLIARRVAQLAGTTPEEVADVTSRNALELFPRTAAFISG